MTPPAFLSDPGVARIWDALAGARVVGGAVRDALAGRETADVDLATPDEPEAVIEALGGAGIKVVATGLAHGTVTAVVEGRGYEVTTLRRDVATDGRHAIVAFTGDWRQDAARRDFSINAMSMARDGELFDYFSGEADLAAGRIRFVGDPAARIAEDFLRVLRFFRFYARFGAAAPDRATLDALRGGIPGLGGLSIERVWSELRRILDAPDPSAALLLMDRLGVWAAVAPEAAAVARLAGLPANAILRLAAMLTGDPSALATRLKLSNEDRDRLVRLLATPRISGSDAALRSLLADHRTEDLIDRTWLDGDADARRRLSSMERPVFPLEGRDVVALGVASGPAVGALLRDVRQWWLDGGCIADRVACGSELARRVNLANMSAKR
ncbi:CCA tRNA nucleotidyltransferase [Rhodopila sp.]|uniref:CCA tRNA nucleotidyltransferase n=1 Tax=Rhodopila sp. TaxID=2480087 RepID=UPI003D12582D